jgi:hypothetical protein
VSTDLTVYRSTGPILETVTRLILHCSRCNTPFKDDDDTVILWTRKELDETFSQSFAWDNDVQGWIRLGDRYLCSDCWGWDDANDEGFEYLPLPAADADKVARTQFAYTVPADATTEQEVASNG